jgi:hypothetical protein
VDRTHSTWDVHSDCFLLEELSFPTSIFERSTLLISLITYFLLYDLTFVIMEVIVNDSLGNTDKAHWNQTDENRIKISISLSLFCTLSLSLSLSLYWGLNSGPHTLAKKVLYHLNHSTSDLPFQPIFCLLTYLTVHFNL